MSSARALLAFMLLFLMMAVPASVAQTSSGVISGRVLDTTGAVIPNANVALQNQDTGEQRTTITGTDGLFTFPSVQPGTYSVTVKASGFKDLAKAGLHLAASQRLSAGDLQLQIGSGDRDGQRGSHSHPGASREQRAFGAAR